MSGIPEEVQHIAGRLKMTPISWKITATEIIICFQEGPKLKFDRNLVEAVQQEEAAKKPRTRSK